MHKQRLAIIDDNADILYTAELLLRSYFDTIDCFQTTSEFMDYLKANEIDVALLDLNYGNNSKDGSEGLEALSRIKNISPNMEVIVMTAYAEIELAVKAIKKGAFDFINKPWQNERLIVTCKHAVQKREMQEHIRKRELQILSDTEELTPLIGESQFMHQLRNEISKLTKNTRAILIEGEIGSGKSLVVKHIHQRLYAQSEPYLELDLARCDREQHAKKIFGELEVNGNNQYAISSGTLHLKHLSKLDKIAQNELWVRLNRLPKNGPTLVFTNNEKFPTDFHGELLNYLHQSKIDITPLRDRIEDSAEIIDYYLETFSNRFQKRRPKFQVQDEVEKSHYSWPSNIKELVGTIERLVLLELEEIKTKDLIPSYNIESIEENNLRLVDIERNHILKVLKYHGWNIQKSAYALDMSRAALYRRIEKYNLENEVF